MASGLKKGFVHYDNTGFNYKAEGDVKAGEEIILTFPKVTANRRGVNAIGWQIDGDAKLYATLSNTPERPETIWQEIRDDEDINKTASAIKVVGVASSSNCYFRIILN